MYQCSTTAACSRGYFLSFIFYVYVALYTYKYNEALLWHREKASMMLYNNVISLLLIHSSCLYFDLLLCKIAR